jgi:hypothetical protein
VPDLPLVRACAVAILLSSGCGEDLTLSGELLPFDEELVISGQVLDGAGRPLWGIVVAATDQRTNRPPPHLFDFGDSSAVPRVWSNINGYYRLELEHLGPTWLHFGQSGQTFAWLEIDAGRDTEADVVLAEQSVVHCQLFGERGPALTYSMHAARPHYGFGRGGGCYSSHGTCGPETLTFIWPAGYERVEVQFGAARVELTDWREPCEAIE